MAFSAPRRFARLVAVAALAAGVTVAPALAQSDLPIVVGGLPNDSSGTVFYAADMGFFEKAGLKNVKLTYGEIPGSAAAAIAGGSITIGGLPVSVAAIAREKGLPLVMIAPSGLYVSANPTAGIIVPKNSPYHKAADLNGKTIATRDISNLSYFAARLWMDKNGGDSSTVHWVEINDLADVAALQAGRIDAASISEPALDAALRSGEVRSLAPVFDALGSRWLIGAYYTSEAFAAAHPDIVRKFSDAVLATANWANKNHALSAQILEKYATAPIAPDSTRVTYAGTLRASDVQPVLDMLSHYGMLKTPVRAKDLFAPAIQAQ